MATVAITRDVDASAIAISQLRFASDARHWTCHRPRAFRPMGTRIRNPVCTEQQFPDKRRTVWSNRRQGIHEFPKFADAPNSNTRNTVLRDSELVAADSTIPLGRSGSCLAPHPRLGTFRSDGSFGGTKAHTNEMARGCWRWIWLRLALRKSLESSVCSNVGFFHALSELRSDYFR